MNKFLVSFAFAAATLTAPVLSFAQSTAPLTRADVHADLIRLESAGYNPASGDQVNYPANIQAAEATVAMQDGQQVADQSAGGVSLTGTSASGAPVRSMCVGPVSFCTTYFGS